VLQVGWPGVPSIPGRVFGTCPLTACGASLTHPPPTLSLSGSSPGIGPNPQCVRVFVVAAAGGMMQGDVHPSWASLAFQPYFTASAANVGFGYWSHGGCTAP
jgi:hypothetical protein